jgi:hypothetical protein
MSNAPSSIATMPKTKSKTYATWRLFFVQVTKKDLLSRSCPVLEDLL